MSSCCHQEQHTAWRLWRDAQSPFMCLLDKECDKVDKRRLDARVNQKYGEHMLQGSRRWFQFWR